MNWIIQSARDIGHVFSVIPRLKALFFLFVLVNIVIGSLGITAPLLAASLLSASGVVAEFIRQLKGGGAYTFSMAFIASSCAFMFRDYIENKDTAFRSIKAMATMIAAGFAILLTLLSGINAAAAYVAPATLMLQTQLTWTSSETLQTSLLATTILFGAWLFCLEHIDRFPDEYLRLSDEERDRLLANTSGPVKAADFEA